MNLHFENPTFSYCDSPDQQETIHRVVDDFCNDGIENFYVFQFMGHGNYPLNVLSSGLSFQEAYEKIDKEDLSEGYSCHKIHAQSLKIEYK